MMFHLFLAVVILALLPAALATAVAIGAILLRLAMYLALPVLLCALIAFFPQTTGWTLALGGSALAVCVMCWGVVRLGRDFFTTGGAREFLPAAVICAGVGLVLCPLFML